jgi:hypothetical protein
VITGLSWGSVILLGILAGIIMLVANHWFADRIVKLAAWTITVFGGTLWATYRGRIRDPWYWSVLAVLIFCHIRVARYLFPPAADVANSNLILLMYVESMILIVFLSLVLPVASQEPRSGPPRI